MVKQIINEKGKFNPRFAILAFIIFYVFSIVCLVFINNEYFVIYAISIPLFPVLLFILINRLEYSILFYIAISPIIQHYSLYSVSMGDFRISPDMVIHLVLLIVSFYHFVYAYDPLKKRSLSLQDKILLVFVLLSVFSLIAASYFPINHAKRILLYYSGIFQPITFYFIILYFLFRVPFFLDKLLIAVTLTASSAAIVAFIELRGIGFSLINLYIARLEIGFGYHNTNLFGMHTALVFPLFFYVLGSPNFKKQKLLLWINFILLSILSVLTLNRGTIIVLVAYLSLLFWKKENRKIVIGFFFAGIVGTIYFFNFFALYINRFFSESGGQSKFLMDKSALYRLEVWRVAIEAIIRYPLGMGGVGYGYAWQRFSIEPTLNFLTPHQILLYIAIDYGVPAFIAFIILFIVVFNYISLLSNADNLGHSKLFYYIKLSLIGYFIHGFLTGGELSHLSGNVIPNNGYTYILMILLAMVSFKYSEFLGLRKRIE